MTSIEWLVKELYARGPIGQDTPTWLKELYEQSKQMYKQEILDAHIAGQPLYSCQSEKAEQYYQETFVSKGSDDHIVDTNEMIEVPQQETLYTEEQVLAFSKWLASNWIPLHVTKEYLWEYDELDLSKIPQDYRGYKTDKQLFDIFQSLKQPKK